MADLLPTDVLLVNRAGVDYSVTKADVMATVQDTDLLLINRDGVDYNATYADVRQGFGPGTINPAPGDWTFNPTIESGTGTEADPFIISPTTVPDAGDSAQSAQTLTLTGLTENALVEWTDNSVDAGNRFYQQTSLVPPSGQVDLRLDYLDTPASTANQVYTGDLQIGTTYFRWVVTQVVTKAPVIGSVVLSDVAGGDRFTSTAFPVAVTMTEEGVPASTKGLKAWVEGTLTVQPESDEITGFTGTGGTGSPGLPGDIAYKTSNTASVNAQNEVYGKTAQDANNNADHPIFQWAAGLTLNGFSDWYIPARYELSILFDHFKVSTDSNSTSWGINPYSIPPRTTNYTANDPSVTTIELFTETGAECFRGAPTNYWTATETSAGVNAWSFNMEVGFENDPTKSSSGSKAARVIRRVAYTGSEPAIGAAYEGGYFGGLISTAGNGVADYALIVATNFGGTYGYTGGTAPDPYVLTLASDKDLQIFEAGDAVQQNAQTPGVGDTAAFATSLYTGNDSTQKITNGIDLAGSGGMVWIKNRGSTTDHAIFDTARTRDNILSSNKTTANITTQPGRDLASFDSDGFTLGSEYAASVNYSGGYAAWSFRKAPGFFDVVAYTGDGTAGRAISHGLGSVPGMMIVKRTDATENWYVYHDALGASSGILLNGTAAASGGAAMWNNTAPTSSEFTLSNDAAVNQLNATYVAYLFASDDTNIKCGTYSGLQGSPNPLAVNPGSGVNVNNPIFINLGWAPEFVMIKCTDASGYNTNWMMYDTARGIGPYPYSTPQTKILRANEADAEFQDVGIFADNNGFYVGDNNGDTIGTTGTGGVSRNFIYIAIKDAAQGGAPIPSGVVASTDATANTMTLSSSNGTWGVNTGNWVVGPEKTVANTRLYTVLDNAGAVSDLQSADPGFVDQASTPTQISFPSTFPTGNAPDVDLPAGTTLTAEVNATNTVGTDSETSNTITPT